MHTTYINFIHKFEYQDLVYNVPKNHLFGAQLFRLNMLQMKAISQKENSMCVTE